MKISKLFHWLYAFLMCLPIIAIGSTILVNVFNNSKTSDVVYKYETNDVQNSNDLKLGNAYHYTWNDVHLDSDFKVKEIFNFTNYDIEINYEINYIYGYYNNNIQYFYARLPNGNAQQLLSLSPTNVNFDNFNFDFVYFDINFNGLDIIDNISKCENIPIVSVVDNDNNDIFYYSVNQVKSSNLFNWAFDSFLVVPFTYIVDLFSIPTNSIFVLMLSYWLDISLIWLVFDLLMYVPLLVHRWLDKAVIE